MNKSSIVTVGSGEKKVRYTNHYVESDDEATEAGSVEEPKGDVPIHYRDLERDATHSDCECLGCEYGFAMQRTPGKFPAMDKVDDLYSTHRDSMHIDPLCKLVAQGWETFVYLPLLGTAKAVKLWPWTSIKFHVLTHATDFRTLVRNQVHYLISIQAKMQNLLFTTDKVTGELKANMKLLQTNKEYGAEICRLSKNL